MPFQINRTTLLPGAAILVACALVPCNAQAASPTARVRANLTCAFKDNDPATIVVTNSAQKPIAAGQSIFFKTAASKLALSFNAAKEMQPGESLEHRDAKLKAPCTAWAEFAPAPRRRR